MDGDDENSWSVFCLEPLFLGKHLGADISGVVSSGDDQHSSLHYNSKFPEICCSSFLLFAANFTMNYSKYLFISAHRLGMLIMTGIIYCLCTYTFLGILWNSETRTISFCVSVYVSNILNYEINSALKSTKTKMQKKKNMVKVNKQKYIKK